MAGPARRGRRPGLQHRAAGLARRTAPEGRHGGADLPGSCAGAIAFKRAAGLGLDDERYIVGETSTLPYAVRIAGPAMINVFLKLTTGVYLAALPRAGTDRLYDLVKDVWPAVEKAESVFQTTLQNGNPVIHPAVTLLNAAPAGAHRRRLPVLRGGRDRERRAADRGGRQRAAGDRRRARRQGPVRAGDRDASRATCRAQLLDGLQHGARLPRHRRAAASSTTAT